MPDNLPNQQALAALKPPHSQLSDHDQLLANLADAKAALAPATPQMAVAELAACLTLVAPSGMTENDRAEWLRVARSTIGDIPARALSQACMAARQKCRFASELVPMVIEEAKEFARRIYRDVDNAQFALTRRNQPKLPVHVPPPLQIDEVVNMAPLLREMGRKHGFIDDDLLEEADRIIASRDTSGTA